MTGTGQGSSGRGGSTPPGGRGRAAVAAGRAKAPKLRAPGADPPRQAAYDVLAAVRERDAYANLVLPGLLRESGYRG